MFTSGRKIEVYLTVQKGPEKEAGSSQHSMIHLTPCLLGHSRLSSNIVRPWFTSSGDKVVDMEGGGGLGCESSGGYGCGCGERGATPFIMNL